MHTLFARTQEFFKDNIRDLSIMHALRHLAISLMSIFIPIYLYEQGFSILLIAAYGVIRYALSIPISLVSFKLISLFGLKKTLVFSMIVQILFFLGLNDIIALSNIIGPVFAILLVTTLLTVAGCMYWMPYHVEFMRFYDEKRIGKQQGTIGMVSQLSGIIAPLLGALVIVSTSYTINFIIISCLLFLSIIPILFSEEDFEPFNLSFKKLEHKNALRYISEGMWSPSVLFFWPFLLYLFFTDLTLTGGLYTISNFLNLMSNLIIGHIVTMKNQSKLILFGTISHGASLIMRVFSTTPLFAGIAQSIGGASGPVFQIPYKNKFYSRARKEEHANHIYVREFYLSAGRTISCALFLVGLLFVEPKQALTIMIIMGAVVLQFLNIKL